MMRVQGVGRHKSLPLVPFDFTALKKREHPSKHKASRIKKQKTDPQGKPGYLDPAGFSLQKNAAIMIIIYSFCKKSIDFAVWRKKMENIAGKHLKIPVFLQKF